MRAFNRAKLTSGIAFVILSVFLACAPKGEHKEVTELKKSLAGEQQIATFSTVSPIFEGRCKSCHNFSTSYEAAFAVAKDGRNSKMFQYVVQKSPKVMPLPGTPEAAAMTEEEREQIGRWILAGAPLNSGDSSPAPEPAPAPPMPENPADNFENWQSRLIQGCAACHGNIGISAIPGTPHLAGMNEVYLAEQLQRFRKGERADPVMNAMAANLTDAEIAFIAKYFSFFERSYAKPPLTKEEDALVVKGEALSASCTSCHAPQGMAPVLDAQNVNYLAAQVKKFQSGERKSPVMEAIVKGFSDEDFRALVLYFSQKRK